VPRVTANGIELYYERRGTGPPLLFLNGSGATLHSSAPLVTVFADRFDVVAHDQRGLGRTEVPAGPATMADYAADALALLELVGWDTCRVVGVSFGGMVAQQLAVRAPERVERLALVCTSAGGAGGSSYPLHELADLPEVERARVATSLLDSRFTPQYLDDHPGDRRLVELLAARTGAPRTPEVRRGERLQLEARRSHDAWEAIAGLRCPTFVAAGRFDGIAPLDNSRAIASRIPGAELHVYEGGHAFFAQDPLALPEIMDFLAR